MEGPNHISTCCHHTSIQEIYLTKFKKTYSLCKDCGSFHYGVRKWFHHNHEWSKNLQVYANCKECIGWDKEIVNFVWMCVNVSNDEIIINDLTLLVLYTNFRNKICLNGIIIGGASCPSELVRVKTNHFNYLLQFFYESGS